MTVMNTVKHFLVAAALVMGGCAGQVDDGPHGCDADGTVYVVDDGLAHDYAVRYQAANGIVVKSTDAGKMPACIPWTACLVGTATTTMDGVCR